MGPPHPERMPRDEAAVARMHAVFPSSYLAMVPPLVNFVGVHEPTYVLAYDNLLLTATHVSNDVVRRVLEGLAEHRSEITPRRVPGVLDGGVGLLAAIPPLGLVDAPLPDGLVRFLVGLLREPGRIGRQCRIVACLGEESLRPSGPCGLVGVRFALGRQVRGE